MRMPSWRFAALLALVATAACPGPNAGELAGIAIGRRPGGGGAGEGAFLTFLFQPSDAATGRPIVPGVRLQVQDTLGNVVTTFTEDVSLKLGANPVGAKLSGKTTVRASDGIATFDTLVVDSAGVGYSLVASAPGVLPATSTPFSVFKP
jgi:hypothetical protein